jgi:hypothetical protein
MIVNIIVGPPCAGKSTHVIESSDIGDVIIDLDSLAVSLGSQDTHQSEGCIREMALMLRDQAITKILEGIDCDSWIIHTNPSSEKIDKYIEAGAMFTVLDPGEQECKDRAKSDGRPKGTDEAIEKWYEQPPKIPSQNLTNNIANKIKLMEATLERFTKQLEEFIKPVQ